MKNAQMLVAAASIATLIAPPLWGADVCNPLSPHESASNCRSNLCPPDDETCLTCCNDTCTLCHPTPAGPFEAQPSPWNPESTTLSEQFPSETAEAELTPADRCQFCHSGHDTDDRFAQGSNHPVEVSYPQTGYSGELLPAPEGPLLVCTSSPDDCRVRCITCHNVHPDSGVVGQTAALLRMDNTGSALCNACHVK